MSLWFPSTCIDLLGNQGDRLTWRQCGLVEPLDTDRTSEPSVRCAATDGREGDIVDIIVGGYNTIAHTQVHTYR